VPRQDQSNDTYPTILWIAWTAGGAERCAPLCRAHRDEVFERYPSARGQGRRGDSCSLCCAPRTGFDLPNESNGKNG
jgi:hypothetical protein